MHKKGEYYKLKIIKTVNCGKMFLSTISTSTNNNLDYGESMNGKRKLVLSNKTTFKNNLKKIIILEKGTYFYPFL